MHCKSRSSSPGDMNAAIADLLAKGEIVAVCRGRMEWGARALGNRSILSCAADPRRIDEINNMIKMRDFWMPFAPSIKAESAHRYFEMDKNIEPDFMTFAFPLLPGAAKDLAAGAHPKDRTIRPQMVRKTANPRLPCRHRSVRAAHRPRRRAQHLVQSARRADRHDVGRCGARAGEIGPAASRLEQPSDIESVHDRSSEGR